MPGVISGLCKRNTVFSIAFSQKIIRRLPRTFSRLRLLFCSFHVDFFHYNLIHSNIFGGPQFFDFPPESVFRVFKFSAKTKNSEKSQKRFFFFVRVKISNFTFKLFRNSARKQFFTKTIWRWPTLVKISPQKNQYLSNYQEKYVDSIL